MNNCFELPDELSIYTVGSVREALLDWLRMQSVQGAASVAIAADKVAEVDGAGVQLLGALAQSLTHKGMAWTVNDPSPVLLEACNALGAAGWLDRSDGVGARP